MPFFLISLRETYFKRLILTLKKFSGFSSLTSRNADPHLHLLTINMKNFFKNRKEKFFNQFSLLKKN